MKRPSIQELVFKKTLPNPKSNDPLSFSSHVQRNLVPEVRLEVQTFYGSLESTEAQYPGLDYTYGPHRRRLARHLWHRRLFRAFDELRLTDCEILSLCQWEGTRSAKERFEKETKRSIRDTTADGIAVEAVGRGPQAIYYWNEIQEEGGRNSVRAESIAQLGALSAEVDADQSDEDDVAFSIGVQLNQQLQAAVEACSRGDQARLDAQWDQWMRGAIERNEFDRDTILQAIRENRAFAPGTSNGTGHPNTSYGPEAVETATTRSTISTSTLSAESFTRQPNNYADLQNMVYALQGSSQLPRSETAR